MFDFFKTSTMVILLMYMLSACANPDFENTEQKYLNLLILQYTSEIQTLIYFSGSELNMDRPVRDHFKIALSDRLMGAAQALGDVKDQRIANGLCTRHEKFKQDYLRITNNCKNDYSKLVDICESAKLLTDACEQRKK